MKTITPITPEQVQLLPHGAIRHIGDVVTATIAAPAISSNEDDARSWFCPFCEEPVKGYSTSGVLILNPGSSRGGSMMEFSAHIECASDFNNRAGALNRHAQYEGLPPAIPDSPVSVSCAYGDKGDHVGRNEGEDLLDAGAVHLGPIPPRVPVQHGPARPHLEVSDALPSPNGNWAMPRAK